MATGPNWPLARVNPRVETPNEDPALHPLQDPGRSLVEELGDDVDDLRQLYTDFGLRPYRVFSVVVEWPGGQVGRGVPRVVSERQFLPTPLVVDMQGIANQARAAGTVERGDIQLRQLSPRYTEEDLSVLLHRQPLPKSHQGWIEVRIDARDGCTRRRRLLPLAIPYRKASGFEWRANLQSQDDRRDRDGVIDVPGEKRGAAVTVYNVTLDEFLGKLDKLPKQVEAGLVRALRSTALAGVGVVSEEIATAQPYPAVDRGDLLRSVEYTPLHDGGRVHVDAPHAAIVELGSRPHWPPLRPLQDWAQRKFAVSAQEARGIAYRVGAKIAKKGTAPRFYMKRSMPHLEKRLASEIESELSKV